MSTITFNNQGVGARTAGNTFRLAGANGDDPVVYVVYNECDSSVNLSAAFDIGDAASGSFETTNGNENTAFIRDGANQIILAPNSATLISVFSADVTAGEDHAAALITANLTTTSHRTVSSAGERVIIEAVTA